MTQESIEYDVVIVGAGPAGLSAGIRLSQLASQHKFPLRICILEKGAEVGAHILSGAVFEPRALEELLPDWKTMNAPINTAVTRDVFWWLGQKHHLVLPTPRPMQNHGNYVISLEQLCRWMAEIAIQQGIDIFPGFTGRDLSFDANGRVNGVITNDQGLNKMGQPKPNFQAGLHIHARYTLVAEGCRGSLTKMLCERFNLRVDRDPQTYGLGIKELWKIDPKKHHAGHVLHTVGFPLDFRTYGGSFLYHMNDHQLAIGFVVGLDYENPYLDPFLEFQRFKQHPSIRPYLEGGERIGYGARALNEGGAQSIPKLSFPGGLLIGCAAGFLNVPKIKGNHTAMKSGMLAAEAVFQGLKTDAAPELFQYETSLRNSWIWPELKTVRNIRPAFRFGLWAGLAYAALDTYVFRGKAPWTFHHPADHLCLKKAQYCKPIVYPKPDGKISFDKLSSLNLSHVIQTEDQPVHLILKDPALSITVNLDQYDSPEQRYCPANVYEIIRLNNVSPYLQINASNCIHCKACDIKDPTQNITWLPPEGGGGPNYINM